MNENDDRCEASKKIVESPLLCPLPDNWAWNPKRKSCDAHIVDENCKSVIFHPSWSEGTSAIQGTKVLNNTRSYWEVTITGGLGGTSSMFGVGTAKARIGTHYYTDLIGEDKNSWGLSHKGMLRHSSKYEKYCRPFRETSPTTVGLLFDGIYGTLTYFKDGVDLGIAFRGLEEIDEPLYPIVSSTSKMCIMTLCRMEFEFIDLQDRCKAVFLKTLASDKVHELALPYSIQKYLEEREQEDRSTDCEWYVPRI